MPEARRIDFDGVFLEVEYIADEWTKSDHEAIAWFCARGQDGEELAAFYVTIPELVYLRDLVSLVVDDHMEFRKARLWARKPLPEPRWRAS